MKTYNFKKNALLFLIACSTGVLHAQTDCQNKLKEGMVLYEAGYYDRLIEQTLLALKQCKYNRNEKNQSRKLLAAAYYEIDNMDEGDKYMHKFLKRNPTYEINHGTDPGAFIDAFDLFRTRQKLSFSLRGASATSPVRVYRTYSVLDSVDYTVPYESKGSLSAEILLNYHFTPWLYFSYTINYLERQFGREILLPNNYATTYSEKSTNLKNALLLSVSFRLLPYLYPEVYFGFYGTTTLNNAFSAEVIHVDDPETPTSPWNNLRNVDLTNQRSPINAGGILGARLVYGRERTRFFADFRYSYDVLYHNLPLERYSSLTMPIQTYLIDDDFALNTIEFGVGLSYSLVYRVKKKY